MELSLRDYQEETIYTMVNTNYERLCVSLPTASGKTVVFSTFAAVCISQNKKIAIAVNRRELLAQTVKTLQNIGVPSSTITAKSKKLGNASVYVMMVETIARRQSHLQYLREVCDVLIVDECHIGNFNKIIDGWKQVFGFSATPMTVKKRESLAEFYHNLYVPLQVPDLIEKGYLIEPKTYGPKSALLQENFKIKAATGDYDERQMGQIMSQEKYLNICVDYVEKFGNNKRVIVYNANIEHSLLVTNAMRKRGINAHHVDGTTPEAERKLILQTLFDEPDCVVNNVGILTFGFDCPEVETIVLNRKTTSLPLYLQMCGRGARLSNKILKTYFNIVDLCGNYAVHGLWNDELEWDVLFEKSKSDKEGAAPTKSCPECETVVHAKVMECPSCGHIFETKEIQQDVKDPELILIEKLKADVIEIMDKVNQRGQNVYRGLHLIKEKIFKDNQGESLEKLINLLVLSLPQWCKENDKKNNQWHKDFCKTIMTEYYNQSNS
jgi:superfamily II DNA or RNA helicase